MRWLCPLANRLWKWSMSSAHRAVERALLNPRATQEQILRRYLRDNADTEFGKAHGFARIDSIDAYRERVPLATWDAYAAAVQRIMAGESNVLTREPVRRLVPSSGSAHAMKLIPYTRSLHREFTAGLGPWITGLYRRMPDLMNGRAYWSISPLITADFPPSKVPIGFEEDSAYLGAFLKPLVDSTLAVPASVRQIEQIDQFRFQTLVHLLLADDLRLISIWHPSFLLLLLDTLEQQWAELLQSVGRIHRHREKYLASAQPSDHRAIWPRLALISAWGDAHASFDRDRLAARWPGIEIENKGLLATEGFVTLPYAGKHPVSIRSHFFEFLDESRQSHLADELRERETYSVVLTTGGGLYRYRLGDLVRVDGFVGKTPSLVFVGKEDRISDRRGEKLNEAFVGQILRKLTPDAAFAILAPCSSNQTVGYVLYLDGPQIDPETLERELAANPHYAYCRSLGQLQPVRIVPVGPDAAARYIQRCLESGQRLGNIKPTALSAWDNWDRWFTSLVESESRS